MLQQTLQYFTIAVNSDFSAILMLQYYSDCQWDNTWTICWTERTHLSDKVPVIDGYRTVWSSFVNFLPLLTSASTGRLISPDTAIFSTVGSKAPQTNCCSECLHVVDMTASPPLVTGSVDSNPLDLVVSKHSALTSPLVSLSAPLSTSLDCW